MKDINFLWQDHSAHDDLTAERIAKINPDKLIVNVDGPGSDVTNPQCGPSISQMISFAEDLKRAGFTGILVMHPDATKGDYQHDWNGKGNLPKRSTDKSWMSYCDYLHEMNEALDIKSLPTFREILIETESSYIPRTPEMFKDIRNYLLNELNEKVTISTTGDWNIDRKSLGVGAVYPQMYDMAYVSNCLRGENVPSKDRANAVAKAMVNVLKDKPAMLNDPRVFFTFSYGVDDVDAPVFGNPKRIWNESLFRYFCDQFKKELSAYTGSDVNTGAWHTSVLLSNWNSLSTWNLKEKSWTIGTIGFLLILIIWAFLLS